MDDAIAVHPADANTIFLGGHYEDVYQRTQAGWRIRTRRLFRVQSGVKPPVLNQPAPLPPAAVRTEQFFPEQLTSNR